MKQIKNKILIITLAFSNLINFNTHTLNIKDTDNNIAILNTTLANLGVLLFQTLNYHWNLTGKEFHDYHLLFDKQYHQLFEFMDDVAERVRAIDGTALGSMYAMIKQATINEDTKKTPEPKIMIENLTNQYSLIIQRLRDDIVFMEKHKSKDFATINFLEELLTKLEKIHWMLKSLQKTK